MIWVITTISVAVNVLLLWYVRELLKRFSFFSANIEVFDELITNYEKHLNAVYELETFYGDSTIEGLLRHTKDFRDDILVYKEMFSVQEDQVVDVTEGNEQFDA